MESKPHVVNTERAEELREKALAMIGTPTFDSLSPERVNALIAEKVMGWHKEFYRYGAEPEYVSPYESWVDAEGVERKQVLHSIYAQCSCSVFTPMTLLDDCWQFEEKLDKNARYKYQQYLLVITSHDHRVDKAKEHWGFYHATAKQKCEAILKAIGEVV